MPSNEIKMSMSLATAKVTTALGNLKTSIGKFATSANEVIGNFAKMAALGLAAAFVGFSKKAIDLGSELSDIAISTGFATEQFQVFRGALIDAGGKAGAMEKSIINMQKAVVQGSEGLTTYTRAFERLGLSVDDLKAMSPEDQFETIGKAIAGAEDQQEAFTSALEIFGTKNAPRLIEVFKRLDKDGYGKMAEDIEKAYGIMDSKTQASLDKAADTIERFKVKATIKVGELISGEANFAALKALGARFGALMAQVGEWMANGFLFALKELAAGLMATTEVWRTNMNKAAKLFGLTLLDAVAPVVDKLANLVKLTPAGLLIDVDKFKINIDAVKKEIDGINFNNPADDWKKFNGEVKDALGDWSISTKPAQDAFIAYAETQDRILKTSGLVEESLEKQKKEKEEIARREAEAAEAAKIKSAEEEKMVETIRLQKELKEAIASGDVDRVKSAEDALKREKDILKVVEEQGVSYGEAANYIDNIITKEKERAAENNAQAAKEEAQAQKMINMERDLLNAVLSGDEIAARAAQKKIDLELRAMEIMERLKVSYEEAYAIAQKLARIEAGPDLNDSGFTTRFEQREFDRQQKLRDKALDNARKQEERDQREQGGNINNVSKDRRKTDFGKVNSLIAQDKTARSAENKQIGNRVRRGENRAEVEAEFAAARAGRQAGIDEARAAQKKFGIEDPRVGPDGKAVDPGGPGGPIGPDGKAVDPRGPGGKQPDPKKPDQAIADGLQMQAGKLDKQIALLTEINASLKC